MGPLRGRNMGRVASSFLPAGSVVIDHDGCPKAPKASGSIAPRGLHNGRGANRVVLAFALLTMALGVCGAWRWSLVPLGLHGRVEKIEYQSESGYRWRTLHLEDGRSFVIDRRITAQLGDWQELDGQRVDTDSGAHRLRVGGQTARLGPSIEFWRMVFTFATFTVLVLARRRPAIRSLTGEPGEVSRLRDP